MNGAKNKALIPALINEADINLVNDYLNALKNDDAEQLAITNNKLDELIASIEINELQKLQRLKQQTCKIKIKVMKSLHKKTSYMQAYNQNAINI